MKQSTTEHGFRTVRLVTKLRVACMLFSGPLGSDVWTTTGYSQWINGSRDIPRHERSPEHHTAKIALINWKRGNSIDRLIDKNSSLFVEENRRVMDCVLDCIKLLSCEMIAFWGDTPTEGKFISLFGLLAKRDTSAAAYLMKVEQAHHENKKMAVNFLSFGNVRLAVVTIKQIIVERIVQEIRVQKKACIIFDSTQDFSKREASVVIMRYLQQTNGSVEQVHVVAERLLEVFTSGETSGSVLHKQIQKVLTNLKFDTDWLVGQCYDGAGNMRGVYSGLATHFQKTCKKAVYIWCNAHRLNLVMNSVTSCCQDVKNTLGLLEELYTFMNGHKRNDVFIKAQACSDGQNQQLKRVSTTRWYSTEAAIDTVLARYCEVLDALKQLAQPHYDGETVTLATGLRVRLSDFRVILCMHVLKLVYSYIGPASRQLQGISIDLASATALLTDCKTKLNECRLNADSEWDKLYPVSAEFAVNYGISAEFKETRCRKKKSG